jgi:adenylate cyclase
MARRDSAGPMAERLDDRIILDPTAAVPHEAVVVRGIDDATARQTNHVLRSLSDLARTLLSARSGDVQSLVLDALFEHLAAERGFIMLFDESGRLRPVVVKHRDERDIDGAITVSKTIVDRVVKERVAILTSDARTDARFADARSVRTFRIRSAMCAPLWRGDSVIGIVHVDSPVHAGVFTVGDLDLLTAMANYAAVAIEQAALAERMQHERIARERLEKYFSPRIVARILSEGELDVQEVEATVVFADIAGFSRLAERMTPRDVAELLSEYFSRMADVVFELDGTIDKFIGDGIMAVFGAPYPQPDHAIHAVQAALTMRSRLDAWNAERVSRPPIEIRIGINSGNVVVGPIGSTRRKEFTVLGDTVNVASRIESSIAAPGTIVVGERTAELAGGRFAFIDRGAVAVRGKDDVTKVYEVRGELPAPPSVDGTG